MYNCCIGKSRELQFLLRHQAFTRGAIKGEVTKEGDLLDVPFVASRKALITWQISPCKSLSCLKRDLRVLLAGVS